MRALSKVLHLGGFVCVHGTTEVSSDYSRNQEVVARAPNTWGQKNGLQVVYDEDGWAWITPVSQIDRSTVEQLNLIGLTGGAYVPHADNHGHFIAKVLPTLKR